MVIKSTSEAGLLNKSSSLAAAFGVTKFTSSNGYKYGHILCTAKIKLRWSTNPPQRLFFNKSSSLGAALVVTKFITVMATNLVTLCCVA